MRALGMFWASLLITGYAQCGQRSLVRARAAADTALGHPEVLICEPRAGGYACTDADGSVVWCPITEEDPCLPVDENEELPW